MVSVNAVSLPLAWFLMYPAGLGFKGGPIALSLAVRRRLVRQTTSTHSLISFLSSFFPFALHSFLSSSHFYREIIDISDASLLYTSLYYCYYFFFSFFFFLYLFIILRQASSLVVRHGPVWVA